LSIPVEQLVDIIESRKVKRITASKLLWRKTVEFTSIAGLVGAAVLGWFGVLAKLFTTAAKP
jgi:hypothetical protein